MYCMLAALTARVSHTIYTECSETQHSAQIHVLLSQAAHKHCHSDCMLLFPPSSMTTQALTMHCMSVLRKEQQRLKGRNQSLKPTHQLHNKPMVHIKCSPPSAVHATHTLAKMGLGNCTLFEKTRVDVQPHAST
jgi:hypothetical protein